MDYENISIEELYAEVRKNSALIKDERIKHRLKELTEFIPEDKRYPLLFAMVFLVANNYYGIPEYMEYVSILLENGANPNIRYQWESGVSYYTILDIFLIGLFDGKEDGFEFSYHHKKCLMILIEYGMEVCFLGAWFENEYATALFLFCQEYKFKLEELSCKHVDK